MIPEVVPTKVKAKAFSPQIKRSLTFNAMCNVIQKVPAKSKISIPQLKLTNELPVTRQRNLTPLTVTVHRTSKQLQELYTP
jgi:hypothetical protein